MDRKLITKGHKLGIKYTARAITKFDNKIRTLAKVVIFYFTVFSTRIFPNIGLCLQGLCFRGLCFRGLRSVFSRSVFSRHPVMFTQFLPRFVD